jgi:hypothetical protein
MAAIRPSRLILQFDTAIIDANGNWSSDNKELEAHLKLRFPITNSPDEGMCGASQLEEAARILKGRVEWGTDTSEPGAIN